MRTVLLIVGYLLLGSTAFAKKSVEPKMCPGVETERGFSYRMLTEAKEFSDGYEKHQAKFTKLTKVLQKFVRCGNRFNRNSDVSHIECYRDTKTNKFVGTCAELNGDYLQFSDSIYLVLKPDADSKEFIKATAKLFADKVVTSYNESESVRY